VSRGRERRESRRRSSRAASPPASRARTSSGLTGGVAVVEAASFEVASRALRGASGVSARIGATASGRIGRETILVGWLRTTAPSRPTGAR
jgi:hypothetical protein